MTTTSQLPPGLDPGLSVWSLTSDEAVVELARLELIGRQVAARRVKILRHLESLQIPGRTGATSTANWLATEHLLTRKQAHAETRLATMLGVRPVTEDALAAGHVCVDQAKVICDALTAVAKVEGIDPNLVDRAETHLLGLAAEHDAKELRVLGRHVLDVLAPEVSEAHEQKLLEAEEERAAQKCRLTMSPDGHGSVHGRFTLPEAHRRLPRAR